jgi:hypothetical protein
MTPAADAYLTYLNFQCNQKLPEMPFSLFNCLKCQHKNADNPEMQSDSIIYVQKYPGQAQKPKQSTRPALPIFRTADRIYFRTKAN